MKNKKRVHLLTASLLLVLSGLMLTGCTNEESKETSQAYYVISEELDVVKTADKAQEILENAGLQADDNKDHQN